MLADGSRSRRRSPSVLGLYEQFGLRSLLAFLSHRVLRGAPRLLFHFALCVFAILFLSCLLPRRATDVFFGSAYTDIIQWGATSRWEGEDKSDDGSIDGGVRIVVFGERDIATPSRAAAKAGGEFAGRSWTEALCNELKCSSHLTFAPTLETERRAHVSNSLYAMNMERMLNITQGPENPGRDYSFLPEEFPVQWEVPDLQAQVSAFLALPPSKKQPNESVWVFSFGTWDIWSLAAFPRDDALPAIDALVADVFTNVERLYEASLNPTSIAHSNYSVAVDFAGAATNVSSVDHALDSPEKSTSEPFRILIPNLFDPTLLPAWQLNRPQLPEQHPHAAQLRNAAGLTARWNSAMRNAMDSWLKTAPPTLIVQTGEVDQDDTVAHDDSGSETARPAALPSKKRSLIGRLDMAGDSDIPSTQNDSATQKALPLRDAITYDMPAYLLDVIIDRQFREIGEKSPEGYGDMPPSKGFLDVVIPCIHDPSLYEDYDDESEPDDETSSPSDENETIEPGVGANQTEVKRSANEMTKRGLREWIGKGSSSGTREGKVALKAGRLQNDESKLVVCDDPDEYLFFTSFTLSQRAIGEIGRQSAAMVRKNETVRSFIASIGKLVPLKEKRPGIWADEA